MADTPGTETLVVSGIIIVAVLFAPIYSEN